MPQVQLAANFFKKEREQAYSNPPLAVWRELFQNSIDQDVTQIDIGLRETDYGTDLTFADNGPGMSRNTLNNVYFNIGNSTKDTDPTKIGGMGRARILTCFAMQAYRILSQDYEVSGVNGFYEVTDHAWTTGCKLIIEVDGYNLSTMQNALNRFLRESRIPARMTFNGERLMNKSANPGRHVRDLMVKGEIFAKVWVNKSIKSHDVVVRVNGVSMFSNYTNANAQVMVELEPAVSRDVLTANRDGLRSNYNVALNQFLSELAVDTSSALRSRFGRRTTVVKGGGMQVVRQRKSTARPVPNKIDRPGIEIPEIDEAVRAGEHLNAAFHNPQPIESYLDDSTYEEINSFDSWLSKTFGDIYLFDEAETTALQKAIPAYNPSGWQISHKHIRGTSRPYRKGGNLIRLLLLWHTAINYAIEVALNPLGKTDVPFAVGFVFAEGKLADTRQQDNGHVFCIRPVDTNGKLDFATSNSRDLRRIMTFAKHEVTHLGVEWHSERFSTLREMIDMEFDTAECLRRMKAALQNAKGM